MDNLLINSICTTGMSGGAIDVANVSKAFQPLLTFIDFGSDMVLVLAVLMIAMIPFGCFYSRTAYHRPTRMLNTIFVALGICLIIGISFTFFSLNPDMQCIGAIISITALIFLMLMTIITNLISAYRNIHDHHDNDSTDNLSDEEDKSKKTK